MNPSVLFRSSGFTPKGPTPESGPQGNRPGIWVSRRQSVAFRFLASPSPFPNDPYLVDLMILVDSLLRLEQEDGAVAEVEVDEVLRLCRVCGRG